MHSEETVEQDTDIGGTDAKKLLGGICEKEQKSSSSWTRRECVTGAKWEKHSEKLPRAADGSNN